MSQFYQGVTSGALPPAVPLQFTTDSGIAIPAGNNLNVLGGTNIQTSGAGSTVTITVVNDGFSWFEKSANFNIAVQSGYFCNASLIATLPASGGLLLGNTVIIYNDFGLSVTIQCGVGESIQNGNNIPVVGGSLTSQVKGDSIEFVFKPSDLTWHSIASNGSWL